jgi:hypothetical protein
MKFCYFLIPLIIFALTSCSSSSSLSGINIQKKRYSNGFYVHKTQDRKQHNTKRNQSESTTLTGALETKEVETIVYVSEHLHAADKPSIDAPTKDYEADEFGNLAETTHVQTHLSTADDDIGLVMMNVTIPSPQLKGGMSSLKDLILEVPVPVEGGDNRTTHWASRVSMITGILGWLMWMLHPLWPAMLILAVVLGTIGLSKSGPNKEFKGGGMAKAGLALGLLWMAYLSYFFTFGIF